MSAQTTKLRLTELTFQIEELQAEAAKLIRERNFLTRDASRAARRLHYLQLAKSFRRPKVSLDLWPTAALLIGPAVVGVLLFVLVHQLSGAFALSLSALVLGVAAGAVIFSALLFRPPDPVLPAAIADAETHLRLAHARLKEKTERLTETNERLQTLIDERRDQIASGKLQRAALLQRNWKAMRGVEWEDFVVEVLRTHGATVTRRGRVGDSETALIADSGSRRIAVLTQGDGQPVDSATIRRAMAAKDQQHCDSCAVVVNRRFTGAAQDFAQRNGCAAIGVGEFPDFVLGKIEL